MKIEGSREIRIDCDQQETSEGDTREKKDGPMGEMKKEMRHRIRVKDLRGSKNSGRG